MKKILLGTTTILGAVGLFAGSALADTPKVTIGGYEDFQVGLMSDDLDKGTVNTASTTAASLHPGSVDQRNDAFRSDTQITFRIDGKTDSGLGYGGGVDLLADTSVDVRGRGANASKTFVYLDGLWGRTELGSEVGAEQALKVDASTIARATGGIAGDWVYYANSRTQFLATPDLPLAYGNVGNIGSTNGNGLGNDYTENLNKVTYYTPRFAGFQVGVSFLPDQVNRGQGSNAVGGVNPLGPNRLEACTPTGSAGETCGAQQIFTGGANWEGKWNQVGLAAAVTGEHGDSGKSTTDAKYDALNAWNAGAKATLAGFSVAGSYGNNGNSDRLKVDQAADATYWTLGGAYEFGPFGASLTYLNSKFDCGTDASGVCTATGTGAPGTGGVAGAPLAVTGKNKLDSYSLGVDYKLAPGLTPYAEVTYYDENAAGTVNDNKGTVGILGTQLAF